MRNCFFLFSPGSGCFKFFSSIAVYSTLLILVSNSGCKKDAGQGGAATIKGKLLVSNYNSQVTPVGDDDGAAGETVYILYGDNTIPDDNEKTSYDGTFEFKYLRKGTYTIFAYSLDKSSAIPVETIVSRTIEIKDKKEVADLSDFIIFREADKGGNSTIKGRVYLRDYDLAFTSLQNEYYKPDEDVFLVFGTDTIYDEDSKSGNNGWYQFDGLRKGIYQVYSYTVDSAGIVGGKNSPPKIPIIKTVEIRSNKETVEAPTIVILKN